MTTALSVPPLGGVGGRSTRYQITDKSPQQLGVIEAGSVLVNESTKTSIYVGDTSVSPQTGVRISPGNTATWQSTVAAYAIADGGMTEPYAQLLVSNIISKMDSTVAAPAQTFSDLIFDTGTLTGTSLDGTLDVSSQYNSLIVMQTGTAISNWSYFSSSFFFDANDPSTSTSMGYVDGHAISNCTAILPVTGEVFRYSFNVSTGDYNCKIWGSKLVVPRVQALSQPNAGTGWFGTYDSGVAQDINIPFFTHLLGHRFNLSFEFIAATPQDPWTYYPLIQYQDVGSFTTPNYNNIFVSTPTNTSVSSDKTTMVIDVNLMCNNDANGLYIPSMTLAYSATYRARYTMID